MADKETQMQTKFHSFLKQRNSKTNASMQEAHRLVNLYRVLNDFGPDFVDEYNKMLKGASDEVQMALKALVGGPEVRQYLEFLQSEDQKEEKSADETTQPQLTGWLPSPEEDEIGEGNITGQEGNPATWNAFVKEQNEKMTKMMDDFKREQTETLNRLMDQLSSGLQGQRRASQSVPPPPKKSQYSEIIEEKGKETP